MSGASASKEGRGKSFFSKHSSSLMVLASISFARATMRLVVMFEILGGQRRVPTNRGGVVNLLRKAPELHRWPAYRATVRWVAVDCIVK